MTKQGKLTDRGFRRVLALGSKASKTVKKRYNCPYDTAQAYITDIMSTYLEDITSLMENNNEKELYLFFRDRLVSKDYFDIKQVTVKDKRLFRYSFSLNLRLKEEMTLSQSTLNTYNDLVEICDFKVPLEVKPCEGGLLEGNFIATFDLDEEQIKDTIEEILTKHFILVSCSYKINKRIRTSIYSNLSLIDYEDESTFETKDLLELFYEHIEEFNLTENEKSFINLTFAGYDIMNDLDIKKFQEVLKKCYDEDNINSKPYSVDYLRKSFLSRLERKLEQLSPFK